MESQSIQDVGACSKPNKKHKNVKIRINAVKYSAGASKMDQMAAISDTSESQSTLSTKTTVTDDKSATQSVVSTLIMTRRRRQSIQCPTSPSSLKSISSVSRRSRSLSTTCSTTSIHNSFIQCSTTELMAPPCRRSARTTPDPLAHETVKNKKSSSLKSPVKKDLKLKIKLGYNHTVHRNVRNLNPPELLVSTPSIEIHNKDEQNGLPDIEGDNKLFERPKSCSRNLNAAIKKKKISKNEVKQNVEKRIKSESVKKTLKRRKVNILNKNATVSSSSQTDMDLTGMWSNAKQDINFGNIKHNDQSIETKDIFDYQKQNHSPAIASDSLNELKNLLNFLTPHQLNWLFCVQKLQRKEELLYLNLWQLYKLGIHQPELIKNLMNIAMSVLERESQKLSLDQCSFTDKDTIPVSDDDNDSVNLVIDEEFKMRPNEDPHNAIAALVASDTNKKVLALKKQNELGNAFTDLLTEATNIADKVLEKLLHVKNQNLEPNDKFRILWPLYELLKQQEKRIEILWDTLLNVSGKCTRAVHVTAPSSDDTSQFTKTDCLAQANAKDIGDKCSLFVDNEIGNDIERIQNIKSYCVLEGIENDNNELLIIPVEPRIDQINTVSSSKSDEDANKSKVVCDNKIIPQSEPNINIDGKDSPKLDAEDDKHGDLNLNDDKNEEKLLNDKTDIEKECHTEIADKSSVKSKTLVGSSKMSKGLELNKEVRNTPDSTADYSDESKADVSLTSKQDSETEEDRSPYLDCSVDEEFLNFVSCNTETQVKAPDSNEEQKSLQRKSPRLHSESSEGLPIAQQKTFKTRRLRIPKAVSKNINVEPKRKSKSSVYSNPEKTREIEDALTATITLDESSGQTVLENNLCILKKANSKSSLDTSDSDVTINTTLPSLPLKSFENEEVELGMQALHGDGSRVSDISNKFIQSEEVTCESKANHANESKSEHTISKTRVSNDPRQHVSYEDIVTFSSTPNFQTEEYDLPLAQSSPTIKNLKRRSLDSYEESNCSNAKNIKIKKDNVAENISFNCNEEIFDPKSVDSPKRNATNGIENASTDVILVLETTPETNQNSSIKEGSAHPVLKKQIKNALKNTDSIEGRYNESLDECNIFSDVVDSNSHKEDEADNETKESMNNKFPPQSVKNTSVNMSPIASPTQEGYSISSPSPVNTDDDKEIDGGMTYPPIPYILFEVDVSRNAHSKPLDINKLMKSNSLDPRIFRSHSKKTTLYSTRQQTLGTSGSYSQDPRNRFMHRELSGAAPSSPQPSVHNAVVSYNVNTRSDAASMVAVRSSSSIMHSNVMPHSTSNNGLTYSYPQMENPNKLLFKHLHLSPWYQSLMTSTKMQVNQTVSNLVRALNNFQRERLMNPDTVFDIFKMDCVGEILEVLSNLGLSVDANGVIIEESQMMSYGTQHNAPTIPNHNIGSGVVPPVNATYSFFQQVLTPPAQCAGLPVATRQPYHATTGSLNEPFFSCYIEPPKPLGGATTNMPSYVPKPVNCCGTSFTATACNSCGPTCSASKGCGCSVNTTCMNHHQHSFEGHQHHEERQHYHSHSKQNDVNQSFDSRSNGMDCNDDRQHSKYRKSYQNSSDSSQRSSYNRSFSNGSRFANSPTRANSPPSSSSPPLRGNGRGGGRGRGGGFGKFNKRSNRDGGGSNRPSSSWGSSSPPRNESFTSNGKFNKNKYDNEHDYPSYNDKTSSAPKQRSLSPMTSPKVSNRAGSPILNSPARQQQQSLAGRNDDDEENWD